MPFTPGGAADVTVRVLGENMTKTLGSTMIETRPRAGAMIARLNRELVAALRNALVQERLRVEGMLATPGTGEQFDALLKAESVRYAKAAQDAGIKLD